MTFVVRPKARRDIAEIADYIAADNLEASDRFINEVYRTFELLSAYFGVLDEYRRRQRSALRTYKNALWSKKMSHSIGSALGTTRRTRFPRPPEGWLQKTLSER